MPKYTKDSQPRSIGVAGLPLFNPPAAPTPSQLAAAKLDAANKRSLARHEKVSKPRPSARQASAGAHLDTNRNKSSAADHPIVKLKSNREQNRATSETLRARAYSTDDKIFKTSCKIRNCSTYGAFRVLSDTVANKVGQALCKNRLCPTCQRVLARKRTTQLAKFFDLNKALLSKYYIYHFVLTLRHSKDDDVRDNLYTSELVEKFKELRGVTGRSTEQRTWWDKRVAGGMYSVELTPGRDGSPHIHLHILLLATMPLYAVGRSSEFIKRARLDWLRLTGDSSNLYIEPIYRFKVDENGFPVVDANKKRIKEPALKGEAAPEHLEAAFAECAKYTLKSDPASLGQFSDSFIADLVKSNNRYYGRFGCLHARDKRAAQFASLDVLNTNFIDLSDVDNKLLAQLYNAETGENVLISNTRLAITPFSNTTPRTAPPRMDRRPATEVRGREHYYSLVDPTKVRLLGFDEDKRLSKDLAITIYEKYESENDLPS